MRSKIVQALSKAITLLTKRPEQKENKKIFTDIMHVVDQLESRTIQAEEKYEDWIEIMKGRILITEEHEMKYSRHVAKCNKQTRIINEQEKQIFKIEKKLAIVSGVLYTKWKSLKKWVKRSRR